MPGFDKADISVKVENGVLSIATTQKAEKEEKDNGYTRKEFAYRNYARSFSLPEGVKDDDINAIFKNGILNVTIPKEEVKVVEKNKEIKVQ